MVIVADNVRVLRPKMADTEKITINLGYVDLGHIDLLMQDGFYSNRTDFIRTAIRNQLDRHRDAVKQSVARHQLDLGLRQYSRQDLEAVARQVEFTDDFRTEQRDDVRADGEAKALAHLFSDGGAAEDMAALEDEHLPPSFREIRRSCQAVVPTPDDDDVVGHPAHRRATGAGSDTLRTKNTKNPKIPARLRRNQRTHPRWVEPVSFGDTTAPQLFAKKTSLAR